MTQDPPAGDPVEHERVPLPVLGPEHGADEQPVAWWEWPLVVLALQLVFARSAWRWSARQLHRFGGWLARALGTPLRWRRWLGRAALALLRWLGRAALAPLRGMA